MRSLYRSPYPELDLEENKKAVSWTKKNNGREKKWVKMPNPAVQARMNYNKTCNVLWDSCCAINILQVLLQKVLKSACGFAAGPD